MLGCGDKRGTKAGYSRHWRRGEEACGECKQAANASQCNDECSRCGKPVHRGPRSKALIICLDCRRMSRPQGWPRSGVESQCPAPGCGKTFVGYHLGQVCCSISCGQRLRALREGKIGGGRKAKARARRAVKAMTWDGVTDEEILNRDGWRCQVPKCLFRSRIIPRDAKYPNPRSKSIDHIVPLSVEANDTALNKRAAHLKCNVARGAHAEADQLLLFGAVKELPVMVMVGTKRVIRREPRAPKPRAPKSRGPRKPWGNDACSRCGKAVVRVKGSRPEIICHECRAKARAA